MQPIEAVDASQSTAVLQEVCERISGQLYIIDSMGVIQFAAGKLCDDGEVIGKTIYTHLDSALAEVLSECVERIAQPGDEEVFNVEYSVGIAGTRYIKGSVRLLEAQGPDRLAVALEDRTELRSCRSERDAMLNLLTLFNEARSSRHLMQLVTKYFADWLGCDAVGIRLQEGDDFPYFETRGFTNEFVEAERYLCQRDEQGEVKRDFTGCPVLECMCGNILLGRFDPSFPFFTEGGSFWSNCTTDLLASTSEEDRQARTRNRCNGEGYESVGLIPLRLGEVTYGLLQINSLAKGLFTEERVRLFERLAKQITVALCHHRMEEALRESEARFRAIADYTYDWESWISPEGTLLWINPAVKRITGYSVDECMKMTDYPLELAHKEDRSTVAAWMRKAIDHTSSGNTRFRIIDKNEGTHWLSVSWQPIFDNTGKHLGYRSSMRDVTDRKSAEDELEDYRKRLEELVQERTAELQTSQRALVQAERLASIGTLSAGIAHEINNPVGMILLSAENALHLVDDPSKKELLRQCLEHVVSNSERCSRITNSILQFARREATSKWPVDLTEITNRAVQLTEATCREAEAEVTVDEPTSNIDQVLGNPVELQHVFVNMLENATQASPTPTRIRISLANVGKFVQVVISDNGPGISPQNVEHLFDPFFTTRQESGGTGLGLSIAHGIIKGHGGNIEVESEVGRGTAFIITLPRASEMEIDHGEGSDS